MTGTLHLVGTPIGNLGDFSPRAKDILSSVDFIAAEDTRVTIKLLNHYEIKKPLVSYYEHNRVESGAKIVERLLGGESCAIVTDAGMPAISDPGEDLVRLCAENGIPVLAVPGPCAMVSALALSGLPTQRFCFEGFLSTSGKSRTERFNELKTETRTLVFYEAPHKLLKTLKDFLDAFGDRDISISRELTKLHEETLRTTITAAISHFSENTPRGEFVLVLKGAPRPEKESMTREDALSLIREYRSGGKSLKEATRLVSQASGISRNELYDLALK